VQQLSPSQLGGSGGIAPPVPMPRSRPVKTAIFLSLVTSEPMKSPSLSRCWKHSWMGTTGWSDSRFTTSYLLTVKVKGWPGGVRGIAKPESPADGVIPWVAVTVTWVLSSTPITVIEVRSGIEPSKPNCPGGGPHGLAVGQPHT
jgi:hypothetical protein